VRSVARRNRSKLHGKRRAKTNRNLFDPAADWVKRWRKGVSMGGMASRKGLVAGAVFLPRQ